MKNDRELFTPRSVEKIVYADDVDNGHLVQNGFVCRIQ